MRINKNISTMICMITLLAVFINSSVCAQRLSKRAEHYILDVLYLKNGKIIRGKIIERVEGQTVKIRYADDQVRVYAMDEIDKIAREIDTAGLKTDQDRETYDDPGSTIRVRKNPIVALIWSLSIPGGGQVYNGEYTKGLGQLISFSLGIAVCFQFMPPGGYGHNPGFAGERLVSQLGLIISILSVVWSIIDAPISANKINKKNGFVSSPFEGERLQVSVSDMQIDDKFTPGLKLKLSF